MRLNLAPMALAVLLVVGCGAPDGSVDDTLLPLEYQLSETSARAQEAIDPIADCTKEELRLDDSDETDFVIAHRVADGELGPVCLGEGDWTMLLVWNVLSTAAAPEQLALVSRLAGFVAPDDDGDSTTVAYVHVTDDEGRALQVSINLDTARDDEDELTLTNSSGDGGSTTSTPTQEPDLALGEPRCAANPGFLNDHSASDPEEDFAEAFSAFALGVDVPGPVKPRINFFSRYPEFVDIRERLMAADLGPLPNTFTGCG